MKKFTGGGGSAKPNSQSDLISLAMAEASKLFDNSGGAANGNKQDAVNSAGMTIMKLMVQSKLGSGGSSGGLGGLMSIVSSPQILTHSCVHIFLRPANLCSKGIQKSWDTTTVYNRVNLSHVFVSEHSVRPEPTEYA